LNATARRRVLAALLVAAAAVRIGFGGWVVGFDAAPRGDEADYHAIAVSLTTGDGFAVADGVPTARRPPAYPVFLAGVYTVTGATPAAGRVAQALLGVVVVWLTASFARRLFGDAVGLVAAALAAFNPFLTFISGYLLTENLYLVFVLAALCLTPTPRDVAAKWGRAGLAGVLVGMATLTRPSGMPMFEWMVLAVVVLAAAPWRSRLAHAAVVVAAFAVTVAPWYARNHFVMGGWTLTTHGGITFYQGNNHKVADVPSWRGGVASLEALPRYDELARMPEVDRDRLAWRLGREYLRYQWREIPGLVKWKLLRFWRLQSDMGLSGIRSGWWWSKDSVVGRLAADVDVGFAYAIVVVPLFVVGVWSTRRRWRELAFPYGVVAVHTAIAVVFFGSLRGRIPVEPVICTFAAAALAALTGRLARFRARSRSAPLPSGTSAR
jgi:4-amino-4-deoxy-L-arabinose transferase-like glycosyltransferase